MKKIIAILLACVSVLSLTACSTSSTPTYTTAWGKSDVYEISVYEITVSQGDEVYFEGAPVVDGTGTYTSIISGGDAEGYTIETVLEFSGTMSFDGKSEAFTQYVTSKVDFGTVTDSFQPTYSEKSFSGTTILYDYETGGFSSSPLEYSSVVTYDDGTATVYIANADGEEVAAGIATSQTYSYSSVYDNEQMFMVCRTLEKSSADSLSFNVLDPITGLSSIALYVYEYEDGTDTTVTMDINGESVTLDTYTLSTQINSTFESGTTTMMLYSKDDDGYVTTSAGNLMEVDRSRLLTFVHQVPYTSSTFVYNLVEYTSNVE